MPINSHCRLCAEEKPLTELIEIKTNNYNKIYQCFQIQINSDDNLPKVVCCICYEQVNHTHEFSEKIHKAQEVLKQIYLQLAYELQDSTIKSENIKNEDEKVELVKAENNEEQYNCSPNVDNFSESESDTKDSVSLNKLILQPDLKQKTRNKIKRKQLIKLEQNSDKPKQYRPKLKEWNDYVWRCSECNAEFNAVQDLRDHFENIHKKAIVYSCMECSKLYTKYDLFRRHVRDHINKYKYRCDICGKFFNRQWYWREHKRKHSDVRKFTCDRCGKRFKNRPTLEVHHRIHLPKELKLCFECEICHKKLSSALSLADHQQIHLGSDIEQAEAVCDQCGKAFTSTRLLRGHMQSHAVGTPHSCDQCTKSYKCARGLKQHKRTAHSDITYSCDVCGQILGSQTTLKKHKLTHSSELPFVCQYCNKGFKIKYALKVHLRQHTGESPYACLECKHYFTNDSNFIKHLKGRHGLKNFSIAKNHQYPFVNPVS